MSIAIPFIISRLAELTPELLTEEGMLEVIVKYNGDIFKVGEELDAVVEILNNDYAIFTLNINRLPQLYEYTEVEYIELPKTLTFFMRASLGRACITPVHNPQRYGLLRSGTIIGIIDSGIDYTHPDFINEDGSSRVLFIWDQSIPGIPPEGFRSGTEYNNQQINAALASDNPFDIVASRDEVGHGTAVSGIAAGNGRESGGRERGTAPEASIIMVKLGRRGNALFARTTEIMRAVKYIIDKARELNMPVAINISYGTNDGSHSGDSLFETYMDSMSEQWKTVIAVATGNEGSAGHHFSGTVEQNGTVEVDFVTLGFAQRLYMTLWKNFADTMFFELVAPSGRSSGVIRPVQRITTVTLDRTLISFFCGQPTHYTLEQELYIVFRALDESIPQGVWRLFVRGEQIVDGRFNIWLPTVEDVSRDTAFLSPSTETTLTIPSTAIKVVSVGGYNAVIGSVAEFSGRGYTRQNVYVKPDLVAPAVGILAPRAGGGYDSFTGTSMAAPFVAGSAALMMEWGIVRGNDIFLYGQRVTAFLRKGATREGFLDYPNPLWGYGALCLDRTMDYLVEYT
jgi:subtilisin family serine protease